MLRPFLKVLPTVGKNVYVDSSSVVIGDVRLGDDVNIWPLVAIRGDVHTITIGARTNIQEGSVLHVSRKSKIKPNGFRIDIGTDVTIGHKAMLHGCQIGNRVLIGMGAIVLDGVIIEDDVLLAAGSLVTPGKRLESGFLYQGSPAQKARPLREDELDYLQESAQSYVTLKNDYLREI
ncbi:gamma carbonic anhydrase family protein [Desulfotalea psychrophila]|nr:gamma carbonic anhydrase family protein [Desulfotalea psychrophila]